MVIVVLAHGQDAAEVAGQARKIDDERPDGSLTVRQADNGPAGEPH